MLALLAALAAPAAAAPATAAHPLPELRESGAEVRAGWTRDADGWWVSPSRVFDQGTRAGALVEAPAAAEIELQVAVGDTGAWQPLRETWRGDDARVLVWDLDAPAAQARLRLRGPVDAVWWELRTPVDEPRQPAGDSPPPPAVSPTLADLGVVSRETWGSRATTCTSTEDDWYRMAIHHTAGTQTSGGTVQGAVQALQAYSMDSAGYCDIPYQFVVGYDGSLWEGRSLTWTSGATGGGNNDGNIAVSFLGCYTGSGCPGSSHDDTDEMMAWTRALVWTLAVEHAFWPDSSSVMGHRDYPGNSTVCPGDYVYARLDELVHPGGYYAGTLVDAAVPLGGTIEVPADGALSLWVELRNDGMQTWTPGATMLATLPRDEAHPLAADGWVSATRMSTVDAVVAPGETGRFAVPVEGAEVGTWTLSMALVEEWVTWFPDLPLGGGPEEGALSWTVVVTEGGGGDEGGGDEGGGDGGPGDTGTSGFDSGGDGGAPEPPPAVSGLLPGQAVPFSELGGGCGCAAQRGPTGLPALGLLLAALGWGRRRGR